METGELVRRGIRWSVQRARQFRSRLPRKQFEELEFWREQIRSSYVQWYEGKIPHRYGVPAPSKQERVTRHGPVENAVRTWAAADINKYLGHLLVPDDHFADKKLLDVGCGPIPYALAFIDCLIWGLDPLVQHYRQMGFPLDRYSDRLTYLCGAVESIPVRDSFFDAVIAVNSIDHVDDFNAAAQEISRVLKPRGVLRLEVHYHPPTTAEPWQLDDGAVLKHLGSLGIEKVHERPYTELYPEASHRRDEKLVIWANG